MFPAPAFERSRQILATPLQQLRGVGPALQQKFARLGLKTVEDALYHLPQRYEDRREIRKIAQLREGCRQVFLAKVLAMGEVRTSRSQRRIYEVVVGDGTGQAVLKWFHYRKDWLQRQFQLGGELLITGEVKRFAGIREIHHPEIEPAPEQADAPAHPEFGQILPVYPLTDGLTQKVVRKLWRQLVERYAPQVHSAIPVEIARQHGLLPLASALQQVHWPPRDSSYTALERGTDVGRTTLVFDEFFFLELGLALKRRGTILEPGIPFRVSHRYTKPLAQMLPFLLTAAQRRVLGEIKTDLMSPHPMNRLVQGDVGCGKTLVALMSALLAIENDTQVAVVAPTEILAEQHYLQFHRWLERLGLQVVLLSGGLTAKEKQAAVARIRAGEVHMVVGTHAVLQEGVEFKRLGLGIIDEQHRFGVRQRGILRQKGEHPHILVMTATPIPRTLALTVYGDLAFSVIDELPPGRTPVQTRVCTERQRHLAYRHLEQQIAAGRQGYIVYPLVEESEKSDLKAATQALEELRGTVFSRRSVALLHGRLKPEEKEAIMAAFHAGEIDLLLATTVIEVGIDVPNATVMVIEHAERFGLAQLHQLRGRVGRGEGESSCYLIRSERCSEDGRKRLEVMERTQDGFQIAEADLEIRGPGEFLGTRQAGLPDFRIANLLRDQAILHAARQAAFDLAQTPGFLSEPRYTELRQTLMARWGGRLELANIG